MGPLLDYGLSVAARNAYHGYMEAAAVVCRERLQGRQRILHQDRVHICQVGHCGGFTDHKIPDPLSVSVFNKNMAVAPLSFEGKEQGRLGLYDLSAVGQQLADNHIFVLLKDIPLHNGYYLRELIAQ